MNERGATALFIAGAMILLMGSAAIAIDIGAGFNERRQAQSAADFGALAAAAESVPAPTPAECDPTASRAQRAACAGAVVAIARVHGNLPGRVMDWSTCTDPETDRAVLFSLVPSVRLLNGVPDPSGTLTPVPCVRFTSSTQGARVVVPPLQVATTFGRVIGTDTITTRATAEVLSDLQFNIVPFGVPPVADATYDCLKAGPNPNWGACYDSSATGNFGYMDIPTYGNPTMNTTSDNCNPTNATLISNIARGVDHPLGIHKTGAVSVGQPALNDDSGIDTSDRKYVCPIFGSYANEIASQTGNVQGAFDQGMTFGYSSSERGRLWDDGGIDVRTAGGGNPVTKIDETPLWTYFTTYTSGASANCPHDLTLTVNDTATTRDCLRSWVPGDDVIFNEAIKDASRFAYAPKLHTNFSNASLYLINEIVAIYLQTSYWSCSSGGGPGIAGTCDIIHNPGEATVGACQPVPRDPTPGDEPPDPTCGVPGNHNHGLNGVTAFRFAPGMLPEDARPPADGTSQTRLALTR